MSDLRKIIIDDTEIEVEGAMTLIQACEQAGIEVPRFCYHERLSIAAVDSLRLSCTASATRRARAFERPT